MSNVKKQLTLTEYVPSLGHDSALIAWLTKLIEEDELNTTVFFAAPTSLVDLFTLFTPPTKAYFVFDLDEKLMKLVAWFTPFGNGALMALWSHRSMRSTLSGCKEGFRLVEEIYERAFSHYDIIIGTVRNEKILNEHRRLGYTVLAEKVPVLWGGVWVVHLTREAWATREVHLIKRSESESSARRVA